VLSPDDRFTRVIQKCRKYAEWGIQDILVYDPVSRDVWYWDTVAGGLIPSKSIYRFHSLPVELSHAELFRRLEEELRPQ
jgi:Uma2 family endonuclease